MNGAKTGGSHVKSVEHAIQILELLALEDREMSLTEISEKLQWPKTTVYGLIATLRNYRFVHQSPGSGRYSLGIRLFEMGHNVARKWNIRTAALPLMKQFQLQYGETVQLGTEDQGEVLYVEKLESEQPLRIVSEIGGRLPMHCSGLGKVLLAYKTAADVKLILHQRGMARVTRRTITEPAKLEKELALIRERGYAFDDREIMDGLRCVAAPIYDRDGTVKYAVSVSGLADIFQDEYLERLRQSLLRMAVEISRAMGYQPGKSKK
ncbi:MAG: IclR family transcriptional regulator [Clostridiales bacterium]|jgi:DNA-binding IclR family transcriptional regulator|nr:IclR family transcriptional regulator [Clostridiales bacterium]